MKPIIICHMISTLNGSITIDDFIPGAESNITEWLSEYAKTYQALDCDAWIVGRVSMQEMLPIASNAVPTDIKPVQKPVFIGAKSNKYAIVLDESGKLNFDNTLINGDAVIVLLGNIVPDSHLAELSSNGVSYIVSESEHIDLTNALSILYHTFNIRKAGLLGGQKINSSFLAKGLISEISLLIAPSVSGSEDIKTFISVSDPSVTERCRLKLIDCKTIKGDLIHLTYSVLSEEGNGIKQ